MNDQHLTPPHLQDYAAEMRHDWDERARSNARWFINTYKLEQSDEEFGETGRLHTKEFVVHTLELLTQRRDPRSLRLLEIGCGIGRMTSHLAEIFGAVYAVDVSHEMVRQARLRLAHLSHVTVHETSGYDFADFPDAFFDLVFSAYVFQHVPNADVIRRNICDAYRVLRPGGIFKFQTSGIVSEDHARLVKNTWTGSAFPAEDIRLLANTIGAQLVSLSGVGTQYLWTVLRKGKASNGSNARPPRIILSGWDVTPAPDEPPDGHNLTLLVTGLDSEAADANTVEIFLGGKTIAPNYVAPATPSFLERMMVNSELDPVQINCRVPEGTPAGQYEVRVATGGGGTNVHFPKRLIFNHFAERQ